MRSIYFVGGGGEGGGLAVGGEKDTHQDRVQNGKTIHLEIKSSSHEEIRE